MSGDGDACGWDAIKGEVEQRYRLRVDPAGPGREPRFTAVARSLDARPYAVVTSDLAELLATLGYGAAAGVGCAGPRAAP